MSYFLDHEVDFFKSCRSVTVTLEGKNDPVDKTLQNKITRSHLRRHPCKKSIKNEIFMARVKNSNCLNFCTQVDPSKTRKAVYFFSSNMFLFSRKTNFSLSPSRIDGSGHNRSKIEHFRSLRISKILRLGKSNQHELLHRLFVFCKM